MNLMQLRMISEIGPLYLVASDVGLRKLTFFENSEPFMTESDQNTPCAKILTNTVQQLMEYFAGKRQNFDVPLEVFGTEFQKTVWEKLTSIPYGKTYSYKNIAQFIQNDQAVRAVGNANGKNPICIVVPCHRVIASDGTIGGYTGGLPIKYKLLQLEKTAGFFAER